MNNEIDEHLDQNVQLFKKAKKHVHDDAIAVAIMDQVGKDKRSALIKAERNSVPAGFDQSADKRVVHGDEPATEKQLDFLKRLGVEADSDLTRQEASELIDQAKA